MSIFPIITTAVRCNDRSRVNFSQRPSDPLRSAGSVSSAYLSIPAPRQGLRLEALTLAEVRDWGAELTILNPDIWPVGVTVWKVFGDFGDLDLASSSILRSVADRGIDLSISIHPTHRRRDLH
jgi:hypothetical protein